MKEMMPNTPAIPELESLPKELAERYVARTWVDGAEIVLDGDKSRIYRIFERPAMIPGVGEGKLRLDARHWHKPDQMLHRDQIRFEYVVSGEKGDRLVAEMHLNQLEEDAFWLQHRYVQPEFRGSKGIGSALLRQAEDWLRQVGEIRHHDVRLGLTAGQVSVFRWLQKQKFWIRKSQKAHLEEILQSPERFTIESAVDDENISRDAYVFPRETEGRTRDESVRLRFEKRITTGFPSPKTDNIMKHFVPSWDEGPSEPTPEHEPIAVRVAIDRDAGEIARIHRESVLATYVNDEKGVSREAMLEYVGDPAIGASRWWDVLQSLDPSERITVLTKGGAIIGFCHVRRDDMVSNVKMLYLDPAVSGQGLGREIFSESLQWLGNDRAIELDVVSYNDRAIRFYERFGFRRQGFSDPLELPNGERIALVKMVRGEQEV